MVEASRHSVPLMLQNGSQGQGRYSLTSFIKLIEWQENIIQNTDESKPSKNVHDTLRDPHPTYSKSDRIFSQPKTNPSESYRTFSS